MKRPVARRVLREHRGRASVARSIRASGIRSIASRTAK